MRYYQFSNHSCYTLNSSKCIRHHILVLYSFSLFLKIALVKKGYNSQCHPKSISTGRFLKKKIKKALTDELYDELMAYILGSQS